MKYPIITQKINNVTFQLKEEANLSILAQFGEVFCVFDQNDSGNISFGVQNKENKRFFVKIAGLQTCNMTIDKHTAIKLLKESVDNYYQLADKQLINIVDSFSYDNLFLVVFDLFLVVFDWFEGDCLFDHWNFDFYEAHPEIASPNERFRNLSIEEKIDFSNKVLNFLELVDNERYVTIDFYDSSIIYNFDTNDFKICDIDLFKRMPMLNEIGENFWGSKRMKSPEEYSLGSSIDSRTNVFKVGAFFMNLFGSFTTTQYSKMYTHNQFIPIDVENFSLSYSFYELLFKAVQLEPDKRYQSITELKKEWLRIQENII
ncbi:serine/threonine protein kinase [Enterococcus saccharolyticus]|uniref:hypothetical protein n=1 Tax=Enterococcus TaxID=1350 RepID=UPI001E45275B|nr:hypothetical protein [Enterococcus saccharolyticus]MCD5003082.1 serine/threonine protein kinase [Enterococcus saccharolyticus]